MSARPDTLDGYQIDLNEEPNGPSQWWEVSGTIWIDDHMVNFTVEYCGGRPGLSALRIAGDDDITSELLRKIKPARLIAWCLNETTLKREPLTRQEGEPPDLFYERVAAAWRSASLESRRPNLVLANEAGVPTSKVAFWVKEARRRRLLDPARARNLSPRRKQALREARKKREQRELTTASDQYDDFTPRQLAVMVPWEPAPIKSIDG